MPQRPTATEAGVAAPFVTRDADEVARARTIVVPGQGAFRDGVAALDANGGAMRSAIVEAIARGARYFGICLGLQLLLDDSEEAPGARGLGLVAGSVVRIVPAGAARPDGVKVPHMGWNQPHATPSADATSLRLLRAAGAAPWFYFVHSFHAAPTDRAAIAATVGYGPLELTAMLRDPTRPNVVATQFHPEKSQRAGLALLAESLR
jgi:glutamine amidotransferase